MRYTGFSERPEKMLTGTKGLLPAPSPGYAGQSRASCACARRWRDSPDAASAVLGKPEIAVGPRCDGLRLAALCQGYLGDHAGGRDPADLVGVDFGKPEVAV